MKIGLVDLDTSHPQSWVPVIRELGHEVVGVLDHGDVHPAGYAETFAHEHKIATVFTSLPQMAEQIDCAILHGCNWDRHVERARPFVEAGCALLIDKPVAGCLTDLAQFEDWAASGVRICGGSALRYCSEVREYLDRPLDERGTPHTILCGCAVDEFNYGIHAYSLLAALMGPDAASVRHVSEHGQRRIELKWADGRLGWLIVGSAAGWHPFYSTIITERGCTHLQPVPGKLYRAILEATLPYLSCQVDTPPVPHAVWTAPERWALAARQSWTCGDQIVRLDAISHDIHYDGDAFGISYRKLKYPATAQAARV
ncbi:MAG: Gfo/Idh/MocA family oxidoreductase [Phycisphaeraceae bacterium]|nr:Gfo/Idh/MocA family oxidoreductase [Phycisphaeraceae bacterium]